MEYNQAQEEAIRTHEGPLLLVSCPGSGKTSTMLRRIADMSESGIDPSSILMVTFTEAAASEMRERYKKSYGSSSVHFHTLHSLAYRILRDNSCEALKIISNEQQRSLAQELIRRFSQSPFDTSVKDFLLNASSFKNRDLDLKNFKPSNFDREDFCRLMPLYEDKKKQQGLIDFEDMLINCRSLLRDSPELCRHYRKCFSYIICDEYQDTNAIQRDILYLLAGRNGNLCVVGDDDQSIYGFRGADAKIMLDFKRDYPAAKTIYMDINYRSLPEIVKKADRLIRHNSGRFSKELRAHREGQGTVELIKSDTRDGQLQLIIDKVQELYREGQPLSDAAVLTRTNAQLEDIAAFLEERAVPYLASEGIRDPYEHFIFRDILCYLRIINGRASKEDWISVINRPNHYFKLQSLQSLDSFTDRDLLRIISAQYSSSPQLVSSFEEYLSRLRSLRDKPLLRQLSGIIDGIDYRSFLRDYADRTDMELSALESKLSFYQREASDFSDERDWYQAAVLHVKRHREIINRREQGIRLCTMHQSKGLEWKTVFIPDCVMGMTPSPLSKEYHEKQEERRLFYVAMTRARDRLFLMYHTERQAAPSIYLREMDSSPKRSFFGKKNTGSSPASYSSPYSTDGNTVRQYFKEGSSDSFYIGLEVHHVKFGQGKVVAVNEQAVSVDFSGRLRIFKR